MERSALYRRALAPISTFVGVVGILAAVAGCVLNVSSDGRFELYWMIVGIIAVSGALLLVRRQAISQGENFWSPPMRRVVQAMSPALLLGLAFGLFAMIRFWNGDSTLLMRFGDNNFFASFGVTRDVTYSTAQFLILAWTVLYGLALTAAGFFMPRGIRLFGWGLSTVGAILLMCLMSEPTKEWKFSPHLLMGLLFGASHLAYGIYLYFTERKNET